ncbi:MAG: hypothetical protein H7235_09760, partial [Bdellovibrionaceae bacterium]|nr:hypothetical protein [Pseudobdellovibrionaceae bacterium]
MRKLLQLLRLTTGLLLSFSALAETVTVPRVANLRSSKIFYGRENILDQLPQGTKVEIVSRHSLPSGANALEVKIISPENKLSLNEQKPLYIWQSKDEIRNDMFKTEAGAGCTSCQSEPVKNPEPTTDIKSIVTKIEEQQSEETSPTVTTSINLDPVKESDDCPAVEKIQAYSNSPQVAKSIKWIKDHRRAKSDGMCYRHAKEILATQTFDGRGPGNNIIPKWYSTAKPASAYKGTTELLKYGLKN